MVAHPATNVTASFVPKNNLAPGHVSALQFSCDRATIEMSEISAGEADRGLLVCDTGIGASIAANKVKGIRAAV